MLSYRTALCWRHVWVTPVGRLGRSFAVASSDPTTTDGSTLSTPPPVSCKIFFGSQTGTAQWLAEVLKRDVKALGVSAVEVVDPEEYDPEGLPDEEGVLAFLLANYGKGEPTDNAEDFYEWVMDNAREPGLLQQVRFAVFGLGNSATYPDRYQAVGKAVDSRLETLGATRLLPRGEGDSHGNVDRDFEGWKALFLDYLRDQIGGGDSPDKPTYTCPFTVAVHAPQDLPHATTPASAEALHSASRIRHAPLVVNQELYAKNPTGEACRHLEFDTSAVAVPYNAGDHLAVFPHNSSEAVHRAASRLCIDLSQLVTLSGGGGLRFPQPCSLHAAFYRHIDLHAAPKMSALRVLAAFAGPSEAEELLALASPASADAYAGAITAPFSSIVDVLERFPSVDLPLNAFLDIVEPAKPRWYSISSSPLLHPHRIQLTVRLHKRPTSDGGVFFGKCSSYLATRPACDPTAAMCVMPRMAKFRLPEDTSTPVIMVGAGSGLAPLRAFVQEREAMVASGRSLGIALLYFGCMKPDLDFLYREELEAAVASGAVSSLRTAFSHETEQLVFVQHRLWEDRAEVYDKIMNQDAVVYVCGNATTMAKGVYETLTRIVQECSGRNDKQSEVLMKQLESRGRIQQDIY